MKAMVLALAMLFAQAALASEEFTKEGKITLQKYRIGDNVAARQIIKLGQQVTFEINAYIGEFFNEAIINANAKITNGTAATMEALYVITFYDAQNKIVGAHAMNWTLKPKEDMNYGSALIRGKDEDFRRVTHYKVSTWAYETIPERK